MSLPNDTKQDVLQKIHDIIFPDGYSVLYPETEVEEGYPTAKAIQQWAYQQTLAVIGENELNKHPETVGSPTAAKLWTRDVFREEQRTTAKEEINKLFGGEDE